MSEQTERKKCAGCGRWFLGECGECHPSTERVRHHPLELAYSLVGILAMCALFYLLTQ